MLKDTARPGGVIRPATAADLPATAHLCAAHAAFEPDLKPCLGN
ncbi:MULTISPECIES: hypothetical protein [unclassified Streptomyces]|nr:MULTISPECIES: hypothetical protein [unclassified Streptomyces]WSA91914.1 hypothetical protein OIE63_10310 [Streptomyces sp. NBC_01795]WSB76282.1 hypothetical protein OHB04_11110 [Streptomyces sp. NBC_01775]WSS15444.1 hypothetical protein OG533_28805 [Streptomyces sp. NBC_01186]WSS44286.1 hypothetical protein OG220_29615 [Streptomyces sp. NBC_01187]